MTTTTRLRWIVFGLAGASLMAGSIVVGRHDVAFANWVRTLLVVSIGSGLLVFAAAAMWERGAPGRGLLAAILVLGVACRLVVMCSDQALSDDAARYHWDGKLLARGLNPYLYAPSDSHLARLRVDRLDRMVNHPTLHTVYPPLAEGLFAIAYLLSPGRFAGFHGIALLSELLAWFVLVRLLGRRGLPRSRLLLVAWLPLLVFEGYLPGHVDILALPFLILFVGEVENGRPVRAGVLLGLASLIKPFALIFLPAALGEFRLRRGASLLVAVLITIMIGYIPFLQAGHWLLDSMWVMATTWYFNGSLAAVLESLLPVPAAHAVLAILLVALVLASARWGGGFLQRCLLAFAAFIVCTPTLYPWYLFWILPFLVLLPESSLLALALLVPMVELVLIGFRTDGTWILPPWVRIAEYLPFFGLLGFGAVRGRGVFRRGSES